MRSPTPPEVAFAWHTNALADKALGLEITMTGEPQCGFFQRKLTRGGVMVPAKIWLYSPTDDAGELIGDEVLQCEIDGAYADPVDAWQWLCNDPITEQLFNYMVARQGFARKYEPESPFALAREKVDWLGSPVPEF